MAARERYYKTLSNVQGHYYSASVKGLLRVEYFVNQWVEAVSPPLFVFKTVKAAQDFCKPTYNRIVFECEIGEVIEIPTVIPDPDQPDFDTLASEWRRSGSPSSWSDVGILQDYFWTILPQASIGTAKVKITRRVW